MRVEHTLPEEEDINQIHHHDHDCFRIPVVSKDLAITVLILNIFIPGTGTLLLACTTDTHFNHFMIVGLLQFLSAGLIIGWIWSIVYGIKIVQKSY